MSAREYVFSPDAADWGDLNYKDRGKRYKRDAEEDEAAFRDDRQFQTKLFGDVEVVVKGKFPTAREAATTVQPKFTSATALL